MVGGLAALLARLDERLRLLRSRLVDEASARVDVRLSALLMERVLGMRLEGRPASVGSFASVSGCSARCWRQSGPAHARAACPLGSTSA